MRIACRLLTYGVDRLSANTNNIIIINMTNSHRIFVGSDDKYDQVSALQFNLLTTFGLREDSYLLDIGCGALRGGRLFIPYLLPKRYYGIEPNEWLVKAGFEHELGEDIRELKQPTFSADHEFTLSLFGLSFDFIIAQGIFTHASERQIRKCLSEGRKIMKHDSVFLANFTKGDENYTGSEWLYPGHAIGEEDTTAVHSTYTITHMINVVSEYGFKCTVLDWPHPRKNVTWIAITQPDYKMPILNNPNLAAELDRCRQKVERIEANPVVRLARRMKKMIG